MIPPMYNNDPANPYQAPGVPAAPGFYGQTLDAAAVKQKLNGMRPWVKFFAVLMFIGAGLMILGGIAMAAGGALFMGNPRAQMPGWIFPLMGGVYLLLALLYIVPAIYLTRCTSAIRAFDLQGDPGSALMALEWMRKFWKFVGIMIIVCIALYIVAIPVMIAVGGFSAAAREGREQRNEAIQEMLRKSQRSPEAESAP